MNPSSKEIIEGNKLLKRLHEHKMKTDVEYVKKMNIPPLTDYNFKNVKRKMKGII